METPSAKSECKSCHHEFPTVVHEYQVQHGEGFITERYTLRYCDKCREDFAREHLPAQPQTVVQDSALRATMNTIDFQNRAASIIFDAIRKQQRP